MNLKTLSILVILSIVALTVHGAVERDYILREDFNSLTGWEMNDRANFTVENGELIMGTPILGGEYASVGKMFKNISTEQNISYIYMKTNIMAKDYGEPDYTNYSYNFSYSYSVIKVTFIDSLNRVYLMTLNINLWDDNVSTMLKSSSSYIRVYIDDGQQQSNDVYDINSSYNDEHGTVYNLSVEMEMEKISNESWNITITPYNDYSFTDMRTPINKVVNLSEITEIRISIERTVSDGIRATLYGIGKTDMIYIISEKNIVENNTEPEVPEEPKAPTEIISQNNLIFIGILVGIFIISVIRPEKIPKTVGYLTLALALSIIIYSLIEYYTQNDLYAYIGGFLPIPIYLIKDKLPLKRKLFR